MTVKVYLDSCIIIYLIEKHTVYFPVLDAQLRQHQHVLYCISPLVKMECLVGAIKRQDTLLQQRYERFFSTQQTLVMPENVYRQAAELRARSNLKTPDALHLATATQHGCHQLWTNDNRLNQAAPTLAMNVLAP